MNRIVRLIVLPSLTAAAAWAGDAPDVTETMRARANVSPGDPARIYSVLAKARRGEPICVAAIGGSITAGRRPASRGRRGPAVRKRE
jgi:hypothetical protein